MKLSTYLKNYAPSLKIVFFKDSPSWEDESAETKLTFQNLGLLNPQDGIKMDDFLKKNQCWGLFFSMQGRPRDTDASTILGAFQFGQNPEILRRLPNECLLFCDVEITQEDLDIFDETLKQSGTNIENNWFSTRIKDPMFVDCPEPPTTCVLPSAPDEMMLAAYMLRSAARLGVKLLRSESDPDSILVFRPNSCPVDPIHVLLKACELNFDKKEDLILSQFELTTGKRLTRNELDQSPIYCFTDVSITDEDLIDARRKMPQLLAEDRPILDWFMETVSGEVAKPETVNSTPAPAPLLKDLIIETHKKIIKEILPAPTETREKALDEALKKMHERVFEKASLANASECIQGQIPSKQSAEENPMKTTKLSEYMAFEIGRLGGIVLPSGIHMYPFVVMLPMSIPVIDDPIWSWLNMPMAGFCNRTAFGKIFQAFRSLPVGRSILPPFGNSPRYVFEEVLITKQDLDIAQDDTQKIAQRYGRYMRQYFVQKPNTYAAAPMTNPFLCQPSGFIPRSPFSPESIALPHSEWEDCRRRINPQPEPSMYLSEYLGKTLHTVNAPFNVLGFPSNGRDAGLIVKSTTAMLTASSGVDQQWRNIVTNGASWGERNVKIFEAFQVQAYEGQFDSLHTRYAGPSSNIFLAFRDIKITQADIELARQAMRQFTGVQATHPWLGLDLPLSPTSQFTGVSEPMKTNPFPRMGMYETKIHTLGSYLRRSLERSTSQLSVIQLRQLGTAAIVQHGALSGENAYLWPAWMGVITLSDASSLYCNPIFRAFLHVIPDTSRNWMRMSGNHDLVLGYFHDYVITQKDLEHARQYMTLDGKPHPWLKMDLEELEPAKLGLYQYLRREVENCNNRFRVVLRTNQDQSVGVICYDYDKEDDGDGSAYNWAIAVYNYRQQNRHDSVIFNMFLNGLRTKDFYNERPKSRADFIFLNADISQLDIDKARQVYQEVTKMTQVHPWLISDLVKGVVFTGQPIAPSQAGYVPIPPTQPGPQFVTESGWKPIPIPEWARTIREEAMDQAFPHRRDQSNLAEAAKVQAIFGLVENLSHGARCVLRTLKEVGATAASSIIETHGLKALEEARFVLRFRSQGESHVSINKDGVIALKMLKVLFPNEG